MRLLKTLLAGLLSLALFTTPVLPAGTIFGLGLSQQYDADGQPLAGAKLYLYEAGTSTPVTAYEDFGLTPGLELPFPIEADAAGRIPSFWLADGAYRVRLTDVLGNEIFDENSITAIGASSGTGGGSGGVGDDQIFQTGDNICVIDSGTRSGWVRMNGNTIGSSSSGANERANADTETLFTFLWNNCSDTDCPVDSGRGLSAAADWASNKTIVIPSMQGRMFVGVDDMGATAAGVLSGETTVGAAGGASTSTTVIAHTHTGPAHTHTFSDSFTTDNDTHNHSVDISDGGNISPGYDGGSNGAREISASNDTTGNDTHNHSGSVSGTTSSSGTGDTGSTGEASMSLMNPYRLCTAYMKL